MANLKDKTRRNLKTQAKPGFDAEMNDRIDRYDNIIGKLKLTSDFDHSKKDTMALLQLIEQTHRFASVNIAWLRNMANVFKALSDKNERYLNSQKGLQQDIEEYRFSVCIKNGSRNFFKTEKKKDPQQPIEQQNQEDYMLKSMTDA